MLNSRHGRAGNASVAQNQIERRNMALTQDFRIAFAERVKREPDFAKAMLDEAAELFLNGEPEIARVILRDLVNATIGFEQLAIDTSKPSKSLHRMLSRRGNPSMDNLAAIFGAVRKKLKVGIRVRTINQSRTRTATLAPPR